jgi:hypothetical protein
MHNIIMKTTNKMANCLINKSEKRGKLPLYNTTYNNNVMFSIMFSIM